MCIAHVYLATSYNYSHFCAMGSHNFKGTADVFHATSWKISRYIPVTRDIINCDISP